MKTAHKYIVGTISGLTLTATATTFAFRRGPATTPNPTNSKIQPGATSKMTVTHPFRTLFAVPLSCDGCIKDVSNALHKVPGISTVEGNLEEQLLTIEGTAPPSAIVKAIQDTGRDAILRGSGTSNNAAVSILETYYQPRDQGAAAAEGSSHQDRYVRGLARMVQVSDDATVVDLTMLGVAPGRYYASIREYGDLKDGVLSAGPVWTDGSNGSTIATTTSRRGDLGTVEIGADGRGAVFLDRPFQVWEVIGHALVVAPRDDSQAGAEPLQNDANTVVGVIARSAGVWDNDKTVCSCSGKTLWQEREDEVKKGML
ncbi:copper chaperone [Sporothrix eucalyptigena]|uniref:Superoxide dismutase 1 copper chaperone n=1 Tax=Sporothrix eucalyptigena TaxID=1812306 RepID=A0ABP0BB62_9PEZI